MMQSEDGGWSIKLADGQSWELIAGFGAHGWLDGAARMMRLGKSNEECQGRITFLRRYSLFNPPPGSVENEALAAADEWDIRWFGEICLFSKRGEAHHFCEIWTDEGSPDEIIGLSQAISPVFAQAQITGGLPLHAALLERDKKGFVIAAPSGTGKSTCCQRIPQDWHVLCDDEVLVVRDREGCYQAHPFPTWSEYVWRKSDRTWDVQRHVKLERFFILQQSKIDFIMPLKQMEIAPLIYHSARQIYQKNLDVLTAEKKHHARKMLFENACVMAKSVPGFLLGASLEGRFWEMIEKAIREPIDAIQDAK